MVRNSVKCDSVRHCGSFVRRTQVKFCARLGWMEGRSEWEHMGEGESLLKHFRNAACASKRLLFFFSPCAGSSAQSGSSKAECGIPWKMRACACVCERACACRILIWAPAPRCTAWLYIKWPGLAWTAAGSLIALPSLRGNEGRRKKEHISLQFWLCYSAIMRYNPCS